MLRAYRRVSCRCRSIVSFSEREVVTTNLHVVNSLGSSSVPLVSKHFIVSILPTYHFHTIVA